ncbi:MAG: hypothetical protein H0X31_20800 [Nostocaceae cyanobacterium]|nr:hypothetical protein [Nostocaceae cyanobacterium]
MKLFKKISAGLLLFMGIILSLSGIYAPFNSDISQKKRQEEAIACLLFGLPMLAGGGL